MIDSFARELELRRPPLWSASLTLLATVCLGCILNLLANQARGPTRAVDLQALGICGTLLTLLVLTCLGRLLGRLRRIPPIEFTDERVCLPRHAEAWRSYAVPYDAILAINFIRGPSEAHLLIETAAFLIHLPQRMFVDPRSVDRLARELHRRIAGLPQGASAMERTTQQRRATLAQMHPNTLATQATVGLVGVMFLNTYLKGALDRPFGLLRWGAHCRLPILDGALYRLVSANFLTEGRLFPWLHVGCSMMALYYFGNLVERLLGWQRTLVLLGLGGLANALWLLRSDSLVLCCGPGGMIFSLAGAFGVICWRLGERLPLGLRQPRRWWTMLLLICTLLPLIWPVAELVGLAASWLAGAAGARLMLGKARQLPQPAGRLLSGLGACVVAGCLGCLGLAVRQAATATPTYEADFLRAASQDPRSSSATLNELAYLWAIDRHTAPDELPAAEMAIRRALQDQPRQPDYLDTLAVVLARQDQLGAAIEAERQALAYSPHIDPRFASRAVLLLEQHHGAAPAAEVAGALRLDAAAGNLLLQLPSSLPPAQASEWFAMLYLGDVHVAAVYIRLAAGQAELQVQNTLLRTLLAQGDPEHPWRLQVLQAGPSPTAPPKATEWVVAPVLPETI
jgi:membrane associated rhomboid family serine protease